VEAKCVHFYRMCNQTNCLWIRSRAWLTIITKILLLLAVGQTSPTMAAVVRRQLAFISRISSRQCSRCFYSSLAAPQSQKQQDEITLLDQSYRTDEWTNISNPIIDTLSRKLHLQPSHPVGILRKIIEARFPENQYTRYSELPPVVTTQQNFDSLGIPADHPGRSRTDTYYVNANTVLRTHTSAHQAETFRSCPTPGFLISADVYRRDSIDKSHYPSFHQMEGAMLWNWDKDTAQTVENDIAKLPKVDLVVEDVPAFHDQNPKQQGHTDEESIAMSNHLKRTLEGVVEEIFGRARLAAGNISDEKLRVRWIDAYFPFTSPSYELEVFWEGQWLELLGCGVVAQSVLEKAFGIKWAGPSELVWIDWLWYYLACLTSVYSGLATNVSSNNFHQEKYLNSNPSRNIRTVTRMLHSG